MRGLELEEGVNAKVNYEEGVLVRGITPLEIVVSTDKKGRMGKTLVYGRERLVVGAVD